MHACMYVCAHVCTTLVFGAQREQKRPLNLLELKLQIVMSCHLCVETQTFRTVSAVMC